MAGDVLFDFVVFEKRNAYFPGFTCFLFTFLLIYVQFYLLFYLLFERLFLKVLYSFQWLAGWLAKGRACVYGVGVGSDILISSGQKERPAGGPRTVDRVEKSARLWRQPQYPAGP